MNRAALDRRRFLRLVGATALTYPFLRSVPSFAVMLVHWRGIVARNRCGRSGCVGIASYIRRITFGRTNLYFRIRRHLVKSIGFRRHRRFGS